MKPLALAAALLLTSACGLVGGGDEPQLDPATVVVEVSWVPPSTPDRYQDTRSLRLSQDEVVEEVKGDETTRPMDADQWENFVAELPARLDEIGGQDSPCVGAGGTNLTVTGAGSADREVVTTVCGGEPHPSAAKIDSLVEGF